MDDITELRQLIYKLAVIDNHGHNILNQAAALDYTRYPLESLTSEAQGEALIDHTKTLAHHRAVNQLAELYGCDPDWEVIKFARQKAIEEDYNGLVRRCLEGTQMLLIDNGLVDSDDVEAVAWHDSFTSSGTKTLLRIEAVAAQQTKRIVDDIQTSFPTDLETLQDGDITSTTLSLHFDLFEERFELIIEEALNDPRVAGFKSVICYRTGLKDIQLQTREKRLPCFLRHLVAVLKNKSSRVCSKPLNDYLVQITLRCIQKKRTVTGLSKPIQFHTGLGDTDINLSLSNPAHLQSLIEEYSDVDFVLLHSSYPYTREAGYLAAMYKNVYLDIGEVFPMISKDGQLSILRQSLELVPVSKILWSTDGHFHPETYWLANKQFREILETILVESVKNGNLTLLQAMNAAQDIMFNNSNRLYRLGLEPIYPHHFPTNSGLTGRLNRESLQLDLFLKNNMNVEFIWLLYLDYTATMRIRMFPIREFRKLIKGERRVGITLAALNMLQNDMLVPPDPLLAGQFYLKPDLNTLSTNIRTISNSATVMTFWETEEGNPQEGCPRSTLRNIATMCKAEFNLELLCGFEIEVVFMEKSKSDGDQTIYKPWLLNHSWSNLTSDTRRVLPIIEDMVRMLSYMDIHLEQFHTESSASQFEFILPPATPLVAVDTLLKTRQIIVHAAEEHGLRATLYPRPFPVSAGTASHVHVSIDPPAKEESFLAGLLHHLPAMLPFTYPQDASYERVKEGIWAGGVWVAWGFQNRETPVRKISPGHWEIKSMDGLANPYLAVAAIIAGGYLGMKNGIKLEIEGCNVFDLPRFTVDVATLSTSQREELGIRTRMPNSLDQALAALEADAELENVLGKWWVDRYVGVRRGEQKMLNEMSEEARRVWLIERY
ncbi:hypothetical protein PRK78_002934 [Emydomyces testavorans]|uniref:GS catalytic domain-containing protein n=1 Tax=Emydomyces testavorans TaxID=2070801 RepID=A0AAF0DFA9_9EURO|nr:hypothetical protein PRK78_002934 [Emydomyces testavorans]